VLEELLKEARGWLADCGMKVIASDMAVISMTNCHYEGGWIEFIAADPSIDVGTAYLLMVEQYGLDFANRLFWQP
jgi:hypothetical protein